MIGSKITANYWFLYYYYCYYSGISSPLFYSSAINFLGYTLQNALAKRTGFLALCLPKRELSCVPLQKGFGPCVSTGSGSALLCCHVGLLQVLAVISKLFNLRDSQQDLTGGASIRSIVSVAGVGFIQRNYLSRMLCVLSMGQCFVFKFLCPWSP